MKQNKIKNLLLTIFALLSGIPAFAQIVIGTDTTPEGVLDVNPSQKMGIVLPRVDKAENVKAPDGEEAAIGTLVFDLSKNCARLKNSEGWTACLVDSSGRDSITYGYLGLGSSVKAIKAAVSNSWAILLGKDDHAVWFSGTNNYGQSGMGRGGGGVRTYTLVLTQPMADIAAGEYHAIAVDSLGRVWTWGYNNGFRTGQTSGTGTTGTAITSGNMFLPDTVNFFGPAAGAGKLGKLVAASNTSSFVVTDDGKLYSASTNATEAGKAGATAATWGVVNIPNSEKVVQISASLNQTVGVVTDAGNAYVWGEGSNYQLGQSANGDHNAAVSLNTTNIGSNKIRKIAMGWRCGAAISQDSKRLYAWGAQDAVANAAALTVPTDITSKIPDFTASRAGDYIIDVGVARGNSGNITVIASVNGVVGIYTAGENSSGQLGIGSTTDQIASGNARYYPNRANSNLRLVPTLRIPKGTQFTGQPNGEYVASGGYNTILITGDNSVNPNSSWIALGAGRAGSSNSNRVLGAITSTAVYYTQLTK